MIFKFKDNESSMVDMTGFKRIAKIGWDSGEIVPSLTISFLSPGCKELVDIVLFYSDEKTRDLNYHVLQLYVDKLNKGGTRCLREDQVNSLRKQRTI